MKTSTKLTLIALTILVILAFTIAFIRARQIDEENYRHPKPQPQGPWS